MSTYAVESVMYDLQSNPAIAEKFKSDPRGAVAERRLTDEERRRILEWDLRSMSDSGVSDMLLLVAFTAINGQEAVPKYLERMNKPPMK